MGFLRGKIGINELLLAVPVLAIAITVIADFTFYNSTATIRQQFHRADQSIEFMEGIEHIEGRLYKFDADFKNMTAESLSRIRDNLDDVEAMMTAMVDDMPDSQSDDIATVRGWLTEISTYHGIVNQIAINKALCDTAGGIGPKRKIERFFAMHGSDISGLKVLETPQGQIQHMKMSGIAIRPAMRDLMVRNESALGERRQEHEFFARAFQRASRLQDDLFAEINKKSRSQTEKVAELLTGQIDSIDDGFRNSLVIGISAVILLLGSGLWFGRKVSAPLAEIGKSMESLAKGNVDTPLPSRKNVKQISEMVDALAMLRDHVQERQRAESLLSQANKHTQRLFHGMHEALLEVDAQGCIVVANPAATKIFGLSQWELVGRPIGDFLAGTDSNEPIALDDMRMQVRFERCLCRRSDGTEIFVAASCAPLDERAGQQSGAILVIRDITEIIANERWIGQFKSALDLISAEVYMVEPDDHRIVYMNDKALQWNGLENQEVVGRSLHDLKAVSDKKNLRRQLARLKKTKSGNVVYRTVSKDAEGNTRFDENHLQLIRPEGHDPRILVFVHDISERVESNLNLQRFKNTLDATEDSVFMFHVDNLRFIYLNDKARDVTGWSEEQYKTKIPSDMNPAFDEKRFRMMTKPLVMGTQKSVMFSTTGLDLKPVELTVELFQPEGSDPWFVVTTRDITQRVKVENENRVFRQTLDLSQDAVFMIWPDSLKFLYQNIEARNLSGWLPAEYRTKTLSEFNPNFDETVFRERIKPLHDGTTKKIVYETLGKFDRQIEVSLELIQPVGAKQRLVMITRDVAERRAAERAKKEFVSTVSHELRTPLTSIKGALGIIDAGAAGRMTKKQKSLVSIALGNSTRLADLINDILDIDKMEAGKMEFDLQTIDLKTLAGEAIEANAGYGQEHGVVFRLECPPEPLNVRGDHNRLMQVMANLLSNAAKFSSHGDVVEVVLEARDGQARINVTDHGSGIPEAAQATIFEKFTQADSSDRRSKSGTGLGLNITQKIVHAHGGDIDFTSVPGEGSTFFFALEAIDEIPARAPTEIAQQRRLLICEDDADFADILQALLQQSGYLTEIAANGAEARKMLHDRHFDGMTLDMGLPDETGLELLRDLRAMPQFAKLPIFVVSGMPRDKADGAEGWGFGVIDWISKPIDETRLVQALRDAFSTDRKSKPRILHVEDDPGILDVVGEIIGDRAEVTQAKTLATARRKLKKQAFDLVILDLELPDGRGEFILPNLTDEAGKSPPVLVFSGDQVPSQVMSRVDGALVKSRASNADLLAMIDWTLNRDASGKEIAAE